LNPHVTTENVGSREAQDQFQQTWTHAGTNNRVAGRKSSSSSI